LHSSQVAQYTSRVVFCRPVEGSTKNDAFGYKRQYDVESKQLVKFLINII